MRNHLFLIAGIALLICLGNFIYGATLYPLIVQGIVSFLAAMLFGIAVTLIIVFWGEL